MTVDIETDFIRDNWYVTGWSEDFSHSLSPLRIPDEPIVIFRTNKGVPEEETPTCQTMPSSIFPKIS